MPARQLAASLSYQAAKPDNLYIRDYALTGDANIDANDHGRTWASALFGQWNLAQFLAEPHGF
jgi:hypothetical protein